MAENLLQGCDVTMLILILLGLFIFFNLYLKWSYDYDEEFKLFGDKEFVCSKNCCFTGWKNDVEVNDGVDGSKYTASNLTCNDGNRNTGCVCFPK